MLAMPRLAVFAACVLLFGPTRAGLRAQAATPPVTAAQHAPTPQETPQPPQALDPTTREALESLAALLQQKNEELKTANAERAATLTSEIRTLSWQFAGLASRFDVQEFESPQKRDFDVQKELEQLIRPLLQTLKDATAEPRQIADMKSRLESLQRRQATAEAAQRAVERTRDLLPAGSLARAEADAELTKRWQPTIAALRSECLVLQAGLKNHAENQRSMFESITLTLQNFVQSSGLSLLLCVTVFSFVLFSARWAQARLLRRQSPHRGFSMRLFEVIFTLAGFLLAVLATLVVPYVRNDWLLLAVGIVFLVGVGWVLVRMAPRFFEQIRLVLNVGAVREGERIEIDGLPYRVDQLRFYSRLHNPDLQGGTLRMPIQDLIGKCSRRSGPDEPWFPCRTGDSVVLADGTFGTVQQQTPSMVVLDQFGAPRTYPTQAFLAQQPRNLSHGFLVDERFGLDYRHQQEAASRIPEALREYIAEGLSGFVAREHVLSVDVQFAAAGHSSLDTMVLVRFAGTAAAKYLDLRRAIQRLCLEACVQNRWTIPFPQLVVHKGSA